ncbi:hypothetical protein [Novosphingobium sp.]|jgi:hypothetical protein|uniref:hypothetical protein n=1 Tax=Novosphingobium sp. TaxID=1874826 RepID=UPI003FA57D85
MTGSMHQGGLDGDADRVRRVVRAKLVEHVRPVNFHRARAYRQALADKTVGQSAGDAAENLSLAARQAVDPGAGHDFAQAGIADMLGAFDGLGEGGIEFLCRDGPGDLADPAFQHGERCGSCSDAR